MTGNAKLHPLEAAALGIDPESQVAKPQVKEGEMPRNRLSQTLLEKPQIESILPHLKDDRETTIEIVAEKPWHRTFAYMLLQGMTLKACADQFDCSVAHLVTLRKQPWFKRVCEQLAEIHFGGDLFGMMEGAAFDCITVLHDLAVGAKKEEVQKSAASDLLDKFFKYRPVKEKPVVIDPQQELERLNAELAVLEGEELNHKLT